MVCGDEREPEWIEEEEWQVDSGIRLAFGSAQKHAIQFADGQVRVFSEQHTAYPKTWNWMPLIGDSKEMTKELQRFLLL